MFLVSGPDLVVSCCEAGLLGTFPALNQRTSQGFGEWLDEIEERLAPMPGAAPFGVNLIVHKSNPRLDADLELIVRHHVPLVITSLGAIADLVQVVQGYGGLVFHDVTNVRHAEKALEAGVDGLIAVAAGAGGHAGTMSPFALVDEIRRFFQGPLALSGAITRGHQIAAAQMMGADLAYIGSHFIASEESLASPAQKDMVIGAGPADIVSGPRWKPRLSLSHMARFRFRRRPRPGRRSGRQATVSALPLPSNRPDPSVRDSLPNIRRHYNQSRIDP